MYAIASTMQFQQNDDLWSNQKHQEIKPFVEETRPMFNQHPMGEKEV